jgi:phage-related baseplate assembly protein
MAELEKIQFVHEDGPLIVAECKAYYEQLLGRQIAPADVEMLLVNGLAYRELLLRAQFNDTGRQNMVSFSRGIVLEYLGELVGVSRLPASSALCTIEFVLVPGHTGVTIPEGLRVQSMDGKTIFETIEAKVCPVGTLTAQIVCSATEPGTQGNDYAVNKINIILDPQAYLTTAQNIDVTKGGADEETDDELRERIKLAPATFSVAGPYDAYKFHAKSANPSIVDVAVIGPDEGTPPGEVHIFPLLGNGQMPTPEIIQAVYDKCNSKKIRPLTDTVFAGAPTTTDYQIEVNLTLLTTAVQATTKTAVEEILNGYKEARKNRLGLDVVRSKISSLSSIAGVYDAEVISPAANIVAAPEEYTNCTAITVNIIGTHDE